MDKKLIQALEPMSSIEFGTILDNTQNSEDKECLLVHRCATDIRLFTLLHFQHYLTHKTTNEIIPFNTYHEDLFETYKYGERDVRRVRAAPRGAAKSTFTSFIKPIHDVCYGLEKFILFISDTAPLAIKKLKDIRAEVSNNPSLKLFYNLHFQTKKPGETEFVILSSQGSCYYMASGKKTSLRGIRWLQHRPSKIITDDYENSKEVVNESLRLKDEDRYFEDIAKTGAEGTNFEFVGTILHRQSLLTKLLKNPRYDSRPPYRSVIKWADRQDLWDQWTEIYSEIDNENRAKDALEFFEHRKEEMLKGAKVLWPEKESYYDLMIELIEIGRRAFYKEKQNDPQGTDDNIFTKFHKFTEVPEGLKITSTGAIIPWHELQPIGAMDPATGTTKPSAAKLPDFTCLVSGYKDLKGRVFIYHDFTKRVPPSKYIFELFEYHSKFNYEKVAIETNLYRELLLPNILQERDRRRKLGEDIKIKFYDVVQTGNKHERIYRLEPKVNHGWILFKEGLSREFMDMFHDFPFSDHDDAPDCIEMIWNLAKGRYKPSSEPLDIMSGRG